MQALQGQGLELYVRSPDAFLPIQDRPLLVFSMDQGSVGYSAWWFFSYHLQGRTVLLKDVFHREWNDCKLAIQSSKLWWVVLLTTAAYNLCYGPWDGGLLV